MYATCVTFEDALKAQKFMDEAAKVCHCRLRTIVVAFDNDTTSDQIERLAVEHGGILSCEDQPE